MSAPLLWTPENKTKGFKLKALRLKIEENLSFRLKNRYSYVIPAQLSYNLTKRSQFFRHTSDFKRLLLCQRHVKLQEDLQCLAKI